MDDEKKENKDIIILSDGKKFNKKTWLTSTLRRASYRWAPRNESFKLSRIERGLYKCAMCEGSFRNGEVIIDHINTVVPLEGFPMHPITGTADWTIFISRLFCDVEGFQTLCNPCSDLKTIQEDTMREHYKSLNPDNKPLTKRKKRSKVVKDE